MRRALPLACLLLVAGCAQPAEPQTAPVGAVPTYEPPTFDETTGAIDGLAVNDESLPLAGTAIHLEPGNRSAVADVDGRFSFSRLEHGTYILQAVAVGYQSVERQIDVVAGEATTLLVTLSETGSLQPYVKTDILNGKTTCTISYRSPANFLRPSCSQAISTDKWNFNILARRGFVDVLFETTWRPTYSYGNELYQSVGGRPRDGFLQISENEGASPLRILVDQDAWLAWAEARKMEPGVPEFLDQGGNVSISTFAAHNLVGDPSPVQVGMVLDQSFTILVSVAYHGPLPAGFTAVPDQ